MSDPQDPIVRTAKSPPPNLSARAPGPRPVRLRRGAALALGGGAALLFGAAFAWAFVIAPQLRRPPTAVQQATAPADGAARPSEIITRQPAGYAAGPLPPPRGFGAASAPQPEPEPQSGPTPLRSPTPLRPVSTAEPSLAARARQSGLLFPAAARDRDAPSPTARAEAAEAPSEAGQGAAPASTGLMAPASPYELKAGAILPAATLTALDTARPGPVVATITAAVYDTASGRILLIPPGARLLGRQDGASKYGDRRAFLVWDRLILPNGKSLELGGEPAVDAQGAHGAPGRADRRLGPLLRASLFAGAISTLGQAARDRDDGAGGWLGDAGDAAAIEAAQIGGRTIGRELDVAPSIRLPPGSLVGVLLTHDLVLEPYAP